MGLYTCHPPWPPNSNSSAVHKSRLSTYVICKWEDDGEMFTKCRPFASSESHSCCASASAIFQHQCRYTVCSLVFLLSQKSPFPFVSLQIVILCCAYRLHKVCTWYFHSLTNVKQRKYSTLLKAFQQKMSIILSGFQRACFDWTLHIHNSRVLV